MPATQTVMLFRYADVLAALTDSRLGAVGLRPLESIGWSDGAFVEWLRNIIVVSNPPAHTRLRSLVNRAFTPRRVAALAPKVREVGNAYADEMAEAGEVDLYASFAQRLPLTIICHMLSVPEIDQQQMQRWTAAVSVATGIPRLKARRDADEAVSGLTDYVDGLLRERRRRPGEDLLSALIAAEDEGDRLSSEELTAMVIQLLVAGHETTRNLIGNGLYTLLTHPEEMARLQADPTLTRNAVEEILRFEPSVIWISRLTREDVELAGVPIGSDQLVLLNLAGANRDPSVHPDPDRFDVARSDIRVLSFGFGEHFCLGASLARLEGRIAFEVLLDRFSRLEFAGEPPRFAAYTALRTLESFALRVTPR
jgi:cytochrome P450